MTSTPTASDSSPPLAAAARRTPRPAVGAPLLRALVDAAAPVLVLAGSPARVRLHNKAAEALFPTLGESDAFTADVVAPWLVQAQEQGVDALDGSVGARVFRATAQPLPGECTGWLLTDVTEERAALQRLSDERARTQFLVRASARLLASLNQRRCLRVTTELAAEQLADAAVLVTPTRGRRVAVTRMVRDGRLEEVTLNVDVDQVPGLSDALAGFPPVPSRWVDPDLAPPWLAPEGFGELGSLIVTPLPGNGVPAGALILLRRAGRPGFDDEEELFARIFAARAGAAISAAMLYAERTETTNILQRALIPPPIDRIEGIDLASSYRPARAADLIGGDFYDVHPPLPTPGEGGGPGETLLMLGDVCGKGPAAAILTGKIRNTLAALRRLEPRHKQLLELLNATLLDEQDARFVTLVLAGVTPVAGGRLELRLTAAGHPAPMIIRADGSVEQAATRGSLIGALPRITSTTWTTVLDPGETCLLFSDGVTEARGGPSGKELFEDQRLKEALRECAELPVEAIVERVELATAQWLGGGEHDDIALLALGAPRRGSHLTMVNGHGRGRYTG
ncbi:PP2C family protein-serine/threonine phosphatase [Streptomyces sp. SPB162]|uniref:PP2C family protein-serine/threonine phosphatase n=1 Tax=Streptomyces sp. SPB162 TaxID=2940560 RepID=UPI002406A1A7|nr:PP2C family protein-serine/threonine phosphatase [Streptomyces sp. SPB162]MDF9817064.1 serine phosphatase RsbU (regulator of sigma subunit) [Streptomyces sp. SPB162]